MKCYKDIVNKIHISETAKNEAYHLYNQLGHEKEKERKTMNIKRLSKAVTAVVACVAILGSVILIDGRFNKKTDSKTSDITTYSKNTIGINSFTINALASEANEPDETTENDSFLFSVNFGKNHGGMLSHQWNKDGILEYNYHSPFLCQGENIESITYLISKGTFQFVGNPEDIVNIEDSYLVSAIPYTGEEVSSLNISDDYPNIHFDVDDNTSDFTACYTEYTVAYDNQMNDKFQINIQGEGKVTDINGTYIGCDRETRAKTANEMFDDLTITCIAHFTDGSTQEKVIKVYAIEADEAEADLYSFKTAYEIVS